MRAASSATCASGSKAGRATATSAVFGSVDSDVVRRQLSPDEHVEWVGAPDPAKRFTKADFYLVPFSVMWGGFAIVWETLAIVGGAGFFAIWGIPFIAVGLYFIFGRFIYKANRKRRTTYAVTDRRVLEIVRGLQGGESVNATYLRSIPSISTSTTSGGSGTVDFGSSSSSLYGTQFANSGMEFFGRGQRNGVCFYDIPDPRGVADLVERLRTAKGDDN
jgi:hypothetical protein